MTELTIDQAIQKGIEVHKAGQLQEADRLYTAILKAQPKHPDANYNMGVLAVGVGKVEQALPFFKTALEANPEKAQFWLSYIDALIKLGQLADAKVMLDQAKSKSARGDGSDKLVEKLTEAIKVQTKTHKENLEEHREPPQDKQQSIINLYNQGKFEQALEQATILSQQFTSSAFLQTINGIVYKKLGQLDASIEAYNKALSIRPDHAHVHYNKGITLSEQGKPEEAILAYNKALAIKPDYAEAHNNKGITLSEQGKLEEAILAYNKALAIMPDYAEAYNNIGNALQGQGKLEKAIEAYKKALAIKPGCAETYNNIGTAVRETGEFEEAIAAYKKALAIKPNYAEAHRHLSTLTKYTLNDSQISVVADLLQHEKLTDTDRCYLHYTYAKMQEDLGDLNAAFHSYVAGGNLRRKLLAYVFTQDEHLFGQIKQTAPKFKDVAVNAASELITHTPIFILGMPRSGTTLVEQIVSSHSEVTGAGELVHIQKFGIDLTIGQKNVNPETVQSFRNRYLKELVKKANGRAFITDKMPQNFLHIGLICAAFPEAKIIHLQRNPEATCWSNFKHYFGSKGLGYSYKLRDTVKYYGLYKDLMLFWSQNYCNRIYNLDYDKLTEDPELETRRLIEYLGLNWEDACLAPQNNKRSVKTASQQQVRKKVYTGSSRAWQKYEPFLDHAFKGLKGFSALK